MSKTLQLKPLYRSFTLERSGIDAENRTVELSASSETPVERWFGTEILDHSPGSVRLDRMNSRSAPLLVNHNDDDQVGVVESAWLDGRKTKCKVRFSRSARAQEILNDVVDGIRSTVSIGYRIHRMVTESIENDKETMRAVDWEPFEVSLASIPADASVGVGRGEDTAGTNDCVVTTKRDMSDTNNNTATAQGGIAAPATVTPAATTHQVTVTADEVRAAELSRCREIRAVAKATRRDDIEALAEKAIEDGISADDFRKRAFDEICKNAKPAHINCDIGMSRTDLSQWSLVRALRKMANGQRVDGLEREASDAVAKLTGRDTQGIFIPGDVMRRALVAGTPTAGGNTIATDLTLPMIELLRNRMVVAQLGSTYLTGLSGNVAIPSQTGGATAYWLAETAEVTASQQTISQVALTPKRLAARTAYSKSLLAQASVDIEGFVRGDLMSVLALAKDAAALQGTGADGQPTGIAYTENLSTAVTFSNTASPTWSEIVSFETNVASNNADVGRLAYVVNATARGKLKSLPKVSGTALFMFEPDPQGRPGWGTINGYPAATTQQILSSKNVLFGNWGDLLIGDWDGIDVVVNPYTYAATNQIEVVMTVLTDVAVRHAASFCQCSSSITAS